MKNLYRLVLYASVLMGAVATCAYGQQYTVKGTVTASGGPVRYAIVTFTDGYNNSIQYTAETDSTGAFNIGTITGVKASPQPPASFKLEQNYPNPFASKTAISYELDRNSDVKVTIYDVLGRVVKRYSLGYQDAGVHGLIWNGRNMLDQRVAPGVYFYRLQARGRSEVRKMLFGFGAPNQAVSLTGLLPSVASPAAPAREVATQSEPFTVMIANTDSTYPLIVPTQLSYVRIGSDTSITFSGLQKLNAATVYPDSTEQIIEGFGGANVRIFFQDMTAAEIHTAFDSASGDIGLTIMRVSIPSDSTQFTQDVPAAKLAKSLGAKIIATPWTPPAWMKTNDSISGGHLDSSAYGIFANYLKAFADTMANNGAPVYAVSVQNEPDFDASYQSCLWDGTQFLRFMKYYAPQVGTPVMMPESASMNYSLSDSTLNDSAACAHTAFVAEHLYGATPAPYPLAISKGKQVWMTEYLIDSGNPPTNPAIDTGWTGAMMAAKSISDVMNSNMSAYVWWELPRYYSLIGDGSYGTVTGQVTKKGYVTSQFARFVRPGYHRVYAPYAPQRNVYLTAYEGNGKTVIVVVNTNPYPTIQPITLNNSGATSFTPYVTSSAKNCLQESSVAITNGKITVSLNASSVTTFVSN